MPSLMNQGRLASEAQLNTRMFGYLAQARSKAASHFPMFASE